MPPSKIPKTLALGRGRLTLPPFLSSLLILAAGSTSARIVTLLALPILTRLYQPQDFGVLALFTSIVAIVAPMATFRFNQAIPLALSGQSAACLAALSMLGTTVMVVLLIPVGLIAAHWPAMASMVEPVLPYWPLVLIGLYAAVIFDIVYFAGIRRQLNSEISQAYLARSVLGTLVKIGAGLIGMGPVGLVTGQIVQLSGGGTFILRKLRGRLRRRFEKLSWRALRATARRYRAYPTIIMPSSLTLALGMQMPIFMITALYDAHTVGLFAFATTVMALPINVLNQTLGNAYYGEISRIKRSGDGSIIALTLKLIIVICSIGLVFAIAAHFLIAPVAAFVLGEEWRVAGVYMSYMAMYAGAQIASAPLMNLFLLQERHWLFALLGLARLGIVLGVWLLLSRMQFSADQGVLILSLALLAFYVGAIIFLLIELSTMRTIERGRG